MSAKVLEQTAREVSHVDHRLGRKGVERLHRRLRHAAGAAGDVREAGRARDVHPPVDRVDPCRARVRDDDPGGAEDRESADDAEARIPGLPGEPLAVAHPDLDDHVPRCAMRGGDFRDGLAHHPARHRVDRGLAGGDREAGPGHRPHARPGPEFDALSGRTLPDGGDDEGEVGHVGVVARVLDDAGAGEALAELFRREREPGPLPLRKPDGDRIGKLPGEQRGVRGPGRGGRAGAGRPAAPEAFSFPWHRHRGSVRIVFKAEAGRAVASRASSFPRRRARLRAGRLSGPDGPSGRSAPVSRVRPAPAHASTIISKPP